METTGKQFSAERIRLAIKSHGLQKQIAAEAGMSDADLSKFLEGQLPKLERLLEILGLEVVNRNHVSDLRKVLKEVL